MMLKKSGFKISLGWDIINIQKAEFLGMQEVQFKSSLSDKWRMAW